MIVITIRGLDRAAVIRKTKELKSGGIDCIKDYGVHQIIYSSYGEKVIEYNCMIEVSSYLDYKSGEKVLIEV